MLVSVLIPTLNRRALLERAMASALEQTHRDLEIVVSDDGSTDGTLDYLRDIARRDSRIRLAPKNPRPGLFENMNHLLEQGRGDFFCILADDDLLTAEFVAHCVDLLEEAPQCVACFCGISTIDSTGAFLCHHATGLRPSPGVLDDAIVQILEMNLLLCNVLYRTSAVGDLRFDLYCLGAAEKDFNARVRQRGPFYYTPDPLVFTGVHDGQASLKRAEYMTLGAIHMLEKHRFHLPHEEAHRVRLLQYARVGYASIVASTKPRTYLQVVASYLADAPRFWELRAVRSLAWSAVKATVTFGARRTARNSVPDALVG